MLGIKEKLSAFKNLARNLKVFQQPGASEEVMFWSMIDLNDANTFLFISNIESEQTA